MRFFKSLEVRPSDRAITAHTKDIAHTVKTGHEDTLFLWTEDNVSAASAKNFRHKTGVPGVTKEPPRGDPLGPARVGPIQKDGDYSWSGPMRHSLLSLRYRAVRSITTYALATRYALP